MLRNPRSRNCWSPQCGVVAATIFEFYRVNLFKFHLAWLKRIAESNIKYCDLEFTGYSSRQRLPCGDWPWSARPKTSLNRPGNHFKKKIHILRLCAHRLRCCLRPNKSIGKNSGVNIIRAIWINGSTSCIWRYAIFCWETWKCFEHWFHFRSSVPKSEAGLIVAILGSGNLDNRPVKNYEKFSQYI